MATIIVSSINDIINGDISSVSALKSNPGTDGISLREAFLAVNATAGTHTITFSSSLAGKAIHLTNTLPIITRDGLTIQGLESSGEPSVTIDMSKIPNSFPVAHVITIEASNITISDIRFANFYQDHHVLRLTADANIGVPLIENVVIKDCVFDQSNVPDSVKAGGIGIATDEPSSDAVIRNVQVIDNTFIHFAGDGTTIHLQAAGTNNQIINTLIAGNNVSFSRFPVELVPVHGSGNTISGTIITDNTFTESTGIAVVLGAGQIDTTGNSILDTVISNNKFVENNIAIMVQGGYDHATNNLVDNVTISNNIITGVADGHHGGIIVVGGSVLNGGNSTENVLVTNNTIYGNGLSVYANDGGSGNTISNIAIQNTIFSGDESGFVGEITADMVKNCIINPGDLDFLFLNGINGNVVTNPLFVNAATGDFHLQAGSPAIDAGIGTGAPLFDAEFLSRFDDPGTSNTGTGNPDYVDIGAYEFNGQVANISLSGTVSNDVLIAGNGDDTLSGGLGADILVGGSGNDILDGGAKADSFFDRAGDDVYFVDNIHDFIIDLSGNDTVNINLASGTYILPAELENLTLMGTSAINGFGNRNDNVIIGNSANNILKGKGGIDVLDGGGGKDTLSGGSSDDTYIVDLKVANGVAKFQDIIIENPDAGIDTLILRTGVNLGLTTPTTFVLDGNLENLDSSLTGINKINLTGNSQSNILTGNDWDNLLKAGFGADTLFGELGDDTLQGGKGRDDLDGGLGDDRLKGGKGADTLEGGSGNDTLSGGPGGDHFYFNSPQDGTDLINDFDHAEGDLIALNGGVSTSMFQWGYQANGATHAHTAGMLGNQFLLADNSLANLNGAVHNAADALFGTSGNSAAYFFGLTTLQHHLYYIIANHVSHTGVWTTTLNTHTIAILAGITGLGTGATQIDASDIILF